MAEDRVCKRFSEREGSRGLARRVLCRLSVVGSTPVAVTNKSTKS